MQLRSKETRNQILNAAVRLFCQGGYDATSVNDICSEARVSKGAFYHHFPSKQVLFLSIIDRWLDGVDANLFSRNVKENNVPRLIARMADTLGIVFQDASGQLPMFMEFMVQASRDTTIWNATIEPYRRYQQRFADLIRRGQQEGSMAADLDPDIISRILISLAVGILLQGVVDPKAAEWDKVAREGVHLILNSVKKET